MKLFFHGFLVLPLAVGIATAQTTFTVDSLNDSGMGTLRQAVADSTDGDTVVFATELAGKTIVLTTGYIHIQKAITIDASSLPGGITISGNNSSRIFVAGAGGPMVLDSLTLVDGRSPDGTSGTSGSNGESGGAIVQNSGQLLTIRNCVITRCRTGDGGDATESGKSAGYGGNGGAIHTTYSPLVLDHTVIHGNRTGNSGAHLGGDRDSSGGNGGGIYAYGSDLTLIDSTVADNYTGSSGIGGSGGAGGGIWTFYNSNLTITRSTISGNYTGRGGNGNGIEGAGGISAGPGGQGGGIYMSQLSGASIENSTIANNYTGDGGTNGAIGLGFPGSGGGAFFRVTELEVTSCTVVGNYSGEGIGSEYTGGLYVRESARLTIADSIVTGNHSESQAGNIPDVVKSITGTVVTGGGNFIGENTTAETEFPEPAMPGEANANGDFVGTNSTPIDPKLGALENNGGPTQTMYPLPGSPVIDSANGATDSDYEFDQIGKGRVFNGLLDIGSVEYRPDYGPLEQSLKKKIRKTERALRKAKRAHNLRTVKRLKKKIRLFKKRLRAIPAVD